MITIFTTPKPFVGEIKISQINAISSWKTLHPDIEIIIYGKEEGISDVVSSFGLVHIPDVETNERGTPKINSMFELSKKYGRYDIQMYINCDIILLDDFITSVEQIKVRPFLMIGQRWDLELNKEINFQSDNWQWLLKKIVKTEGVLHDAAGIDYFVYSQGIWGNIPDMVIGRAGYDNWLIYYCRSHKIPVIDATQVITAIHQNHDYRHVEKGKNEVFEGNEANNNLRLAGGHRYLLKISDSDWKLLPIDLVRNRMTKNNWYRYLDIYSLLSDSIIFKTIWRIVKLGYNFYRRVKRSVYRKSELSIK